MSVSRSRPLLSCLESACRSVEVDFPLGRRVEQPPAIMRVLVKQIEDGAVACLQHMRARHLDEFARLGKAKNAGFLLDGLARSLIPLIAIPTSTQRQVEVGERLWPSVWSETFSRNRLSEPSSNGSSYRAHRGGYPGSTRPFGRRRAPHSWGRRTPGEGAAATRPFSRRKPSVW